MTIEKIRPPLSIDDPRIEQLKQLFPEAFADGEPQPEVLLELLGIVDEGSDTPEHFGINWPGKRIAKAFANQPARSSLHSAQGVRDNETHHIFIESENLEALKLLRKSYASSIKLIYIDPPYNTGSDFVYSDDYSETLVEYGKRSGVYDLQGRKLTSVNSINSGRFHATWLSMMYPRLILAWQLLTDEGIICISIDDNEVHHLRMLLDEIFGSENFIAEMVWEGGLKNDSRFVSISHDYIVCYAKNRQNLTINQSIWRTRKAGLDLIYTKVESLRKQFKNDYSSITIELRKWYSTLDKTSPAWGHKHYRTVDENGVYFKDNISWPGGGGPKYEIIHPVSGKPVKIPQGGWRIASFEKMSELIKDGRIVFGVDETKVPTIKRYLHETESQVLPSVFYKDRRSSMKRLKELMGADVFENPKDEEVLQKLIEALTSDTDIILDFFSGSSSLAHAVMNQNALDSGMRKYICIQMPELIKPDTECGKTAIIMGYQTVADIGRARIEKVIKIFEKANLDHIDLGYRYFKLEPTVFLPWKAFSGTDPIQLEAQLYEAQTPLRPGWKPEDLLTEILLLEGFPLDSRQRPLPNIPHNQVIEVSSDTCAHVLYVCLDSSIRPASLMTLKVQPHDIFICLDTALSDDEKIQLNDICKLKVI